MRDVSLADITFAEDTVIDTSNRDRKVPEAPMGKSKLVDQNLRKDSKKTQIHSQQMKRPHDRTSSFMTFTATNKLEATSTKHYFWRKSTF